MYRLQRALLRGVKQDPPCLSTKVLLGKLIGSGHFSEVYEGQIIDEEKTSTKVVIKQLRGNTSASVRLGYDHEGRIFNLCAGQHVAKLVGTLPQLEEGQGGGLVLEAMTMSVAEWFKNKKPITTEILALISRDCARGFARVLVVWSIHECCI